VRFLNRIRRSLRVDDAELQDIPHKGPWREARTS
jgi:hypothetical protein